MTGSAGVGMVNVILVRKLIGDLREKKRLLEGRRIRRLGELQSDPFLSNATQHLIEIMVEICIDIGNHIIADEGWPAPSSNRQIFEILEAKGVISPALAALAKKMVGFRNIVVHMYEKVDLQEVYAIYKKHLGGFERFAGEIEKFLPRRSA